MIAGFSALAAGGLMLTLVLSQLTGWDLSALGNLTRPRRIELEGHPNWRIWPNLERLNVRDTGVTGCIPGELFTRLLSVQTNGLRPC